MSRKAVLLLVAIAAACFPLVAAFAGGLPELVLQTGHHKLVRSVAFSYDNKWVATGSFDDTIRIWSVDTGRELRSLTGHQGAVTALAWSPDGRTIASSANDDTVRTWNTERGTQASVLPGKKGVTSLVFIANGARLVYIDGQGHIFINDIASGRDIADIPGPIDGPAVLAATPDGGLIVSGSRSGAVKTWDAATGKLLRSLSQKGAGITTLKIVGGLLASGDESGAIRLWDLRTGRRYAALKHGTDPIVAMEFHSAERLLSIDALGVDGCWKNNGKNEWSRDTGHTNTPKREIETAAFSPDASLVAVGNGDGSATLLDSASGRVMQEFQNHTVGFYGVDLSGDGHWLAGAGFDNTVKVWDLRTGIALPPLAGHTGRVTGVAFSGKDRLVSASVDHTLRVWDLLTMRCLAILSGHTNSISGVAVGSKGTIISAGADGMVGIWNPVSRQPRFLIGHRGEVISVAISPDEQTIASTGVDGTVRLWNMDLGTQIAVIEPKAGEIDSVSFSPDGRLIATAGIDGIARIWETRNSSILATLTGHEGKINSVAFSPDGRSIVTSGQDRSFRLWDISAAREVMSVNAHSGTVFGAAYSADGRLIASASDDGSIALWSVRNGERIVTLLALRNSADWLAVTPTGFFDGSSQSWTQLSWRFEGDTFNTNPIEIFFSEYYVPGLLSDLLSGRDLPHVDAVSNRERRQPAVKMTLATDKPSAGRMVRVTIDLASASAGARDLRLFRNGALVKVWPGDVLAGGNSARLQAQIPILAGQNRLTAYAFNNDNIKSSDSVLTVSGPVSIARKGTLYLLAIGINEYENREFDLRYAVADADDFAGEVRLRQSRLDGYDKTEIIPLRNTDAGKVSILEALRGLAARTQPEDGVIIYFAGHGIANKNRFYLVPHDIGYKGKRGELTERGLEGILASSISDEELEIAVRDIDAGQFLLVIDACNSGQMLEAEEKRRGPMNSKGLAQLAYEKGMYILTAAQSYQAAQEAAKLGHGFLTYALVEEGLKTSVADDSPRDGEITLREWLDFAAARVPQIQQEDLTARELTRDKSAGKPVIDELSIQRPRVFYRREPDTRPFIVARH